MKKSAAILLVIISIFLASCASQGTAIPEVTVTFALPTITQTPEPSATPTTVYTPTPQKEIVKRPSGVGIDLGLQIEGQPEGVRLVNDLIPNSVWKADRQAEFELRNNPEIYGFLLGETQLVYIPTEDSQGRVELQRSSTADVIAVFGSEGFAWIPEQLVDDNGEPIALRTGKIVEMKYRVPVDQHAEDLAVVPMLNDFLRLTRFGSPFSVAPSIFISKDGTQGVQFSFFSKKDDSEGFIYFRAVDGKTLIYMYVEGYDINNLDFAERLQGWW